MMKIGIVGTGMLGEAVGLHLLDVGYKITVFNRSKEKTEKLENKGALVVDSPKNVAENSIMVGIPAKNVGESTPNDKTFKPYGITADSDKS